MITRFTFMLCCLALAVALGGGCRRHGPARPASVADLSPPPPAASRGPRTVTERTTETETVVTYDPEKERRALNDAEGKIAWLDRRFEPIYFEPGSAELDLNARRRLDEHGDWMKTNPSNYLVLIGHDDRTNTVEMGYNVGMARALAVLDYMNAHGVAAQRLYPLTYGPERPMTDADTTETASLNRCVELKAFSVSTQGVGKPTVPVTTAAPQLEKPEPRTPAPEVAP